MTRQQTAPRHTNRLISETSPYLLQHAHNPVDWYPWGKEALQRAREENRPILLSIGYSACHWCHVMVRKAQADYPRPPGLWRPWGWAGDSARGHPDLRGGVIGDQSHLILLSDGRPSSRLPQPPRSHGKARRPAGPIHNEAQREVRE